MEHLKRTGNVLTEGLVVHCPWCGAHMAGADSDGGQRVCITHGWFIVNVAFGPDQQHIIKVKTL